MSRLSPLLRTGSWLLCVALVLSSAVTLPVHAQPVRSDISQDVSIVEIEKFPFPRRIAGLSRKEKTDFRSPGLGFSVSYRNDSAAWADIYIYDRQFDLPPRPSLPLARKELESAIDAIHASIKLDRFQSVVIQNLSDSNSFAKAHLKITAGGKERDSFVFVSVRERKFVKIRLTSEAGPRSTEIAQRFLKEYEQVLTGNAQK